MWHKVLQQTEYAHSKGALQPISTNYEFVEESGIRFLVRVVSNLERKHQAKQQNANVIKGKDFNPFLPYEQDLFVTDISDTHICLLNKFNIVDHHLLLVTRQFEEQESLLTQQDFEAMWITLAEIDGLVFYNSGQAAGASQRHKHLQIIPLPLTPEGASIPIEVALKSIEFKDGVGRIPSFQFKHAIAQLDPTWVNSPLQGASATLDCYHTLLSYLNLPVNSKPAPYNLLATREWMMIIARSQERFQSISINSLGFAGALLVRNEEQLQLVKELSPLTILKNVAVTEE
ncbi:ATP adenylyltransferase [Crinalium epipsammum PCC 9333]|uniref:ATP adenylyltransferase n=1 Tax=Crinalium epipsammum PCC 9333 TaxID=1173022 RepID=K9VU23_9CYAN|nr:ATP adenylyltransferase [Crinalium epipsammum PCC 9333]